MPRARGLQLLPVGELVLAARPLEDNEAEAALAAVDRVAQHADEGRDAGHRRDHEMDGKLSSRVKTPFGRGRRETASPTRSVQSFGVSSPVRNQLEEELEEGLVRGGDDRIGTLDAIEPDGAVLSRREGVGNLGLPGEPPPNPA